MTGEMAFNYTDSSEDYVTASGISELDEMRYSLGNPFHSTPISGHAIRSIEEISFDGSGEKRISEISVDKRSSLSAQSISDHDVFISAEETAQTNAKSRKSTRISLILSKLLTIDDENSTVFDQNKRVEEKLDIVVHSNEEEMYVTKRIDNIILPSNNKQKVNKLKEVNPLVRLHDNSCFSPEYGESENNTLGKNGSDQNKNLQSTEQKDKSRTIREKELFVHLHENSVAYFSSEESEGGKDILCENESDRREELQCTEGNNKRSGVRQKKAVQLQDDSNVQCVSEYSESDNDSCMKNGDQEEKLQPIDSKVKKLGSLNSGIQTAISDMKFNKQNVTPEIQIIDTENKSSKLKVSDMRVYREVQKPQITQSRHQLKCEIDVLTKDITNLKSALRSIDVSTLPDNGMKLQMKLQASILLLKIKERELEKLSANLQSESSREEEPVGLGVKALQNQIREKTLPETAPIDFHGSISTCPSENVLADPPVGLKTSVELMSHQKHALAWLLWRETQRPPSGILADDMGLGKTLTMISLVLKAKEEVDVKVDNKTCDNEYEDDVDEYPLGGTLVVCPASLLLQWEDEIKKHCKGGVLEIEIHHGSDRDENVRRLSQNDIVITTYSILRMSVNKGGKEESVERSKRGVLHRVQWRRIILDEAHVVRNYKSQLSRAVCLLMGHRRWALTGTPIHNKELDLYALLKFLRCSPFDGYKVWRRWMDNKNSAGIKRLNTVINTIMLRRTKSVLQDKGELTRLPEKTLSEIFVQLEKNEFDVYTKILWFSKTLFAQFLQQRADEKMSGFHAGVFSKPAYLKNPDGTDNPFSNNPELAKMFHRMQQMHDIKTHEILVLLLRLRQVCVHPGLIKAMLNEEAKQSGGTDNSDGLGNDILSHMGAMSLEDPSQKRQDDEMEHILQVNNSVFDLNRASSKMKAIFKVLKEKVLTTADKAIIVSQWTSVLNILKEHLMDFGVQCVILTGTVPVKDRMNIVKSFNSENGSRVLLLSLTAGGVGLNLTGGNHLFLIDMHWNPQWESQAFDRVHRVGQKKPVFIYKFICQETIEERIKLLQDRKLSIAEGVLSGTVRRNFNEPTLEDLRSLFSM